MANNSISGHGVDANDNLWIADDEANVIQKVSSDGTTWTTYTNTDHPEIEQPAGDFYFHTDGSIWVPSDIEGAIKFDGETWANPLAGQLDETEDQMVYAIDSDATGKLYFAHKQGVTTFLDDEWEDLFIEDIPEGFFHRSNILFDDEGTLWWANDMFGVFSYTPSTTTPVSLGFEEATGFSVYPNPAERYSVIDFTIKESARVQAVVYNHLGQVIRSVDFGLMPAGVFKETIEVNDLPKGFYSVQLQIDGQFFTKPLIMQ